MEGHSEFTGSGGLVVSMSETGSQSYLRVPENQHDYRLMSLDLRVISHVLNSPIYEKPWQTRSLLSRLVGRGKSRAYFISVTHGDSR
jgi:hypothetical protein